MNFNKHYKLKNTHALLSGSKYHWLDYDDDKLRNYYNQSRAAARGTRLHDIAKELIEMGIKLPRSTKTLNMYVNDAIGFKMTPEQPVYYSDLCYGFVDAISFNTKTKTLRIHDLKTGVTKSSFKQLLIYAACFCLEYSVKPLDINVEFRIYQNDECIIYNPEPEEIDDVIDRIINADKIISSYIISTETY